MQNVLDKKYAEGFYDGVNCGASAFFDVMARVANKPDIKTLQELVDTVAREWKAYEPEYVAAVHRRLIERHAMNNMPSHEC